MNNSVILYLENMTSAIDDFFVKSEVCYQITFYCEPTVDFYRTFLFRHFQFCVPTETIFLVRLMFSGKCKHNVNNNETNNFCKYAS